MWRLGAVLVLAIVLPNSASADQSAIITRLRRSPQYCPPDYPPPPHHWPPRRFHHHQRGYPPPPYYGEGLAQAQASAAQAQYEAQAAAVAQAGTASQAGAQTVALPQGPPNGQSQALSQPLPGPPCETCNQGNHAVSNANSDTGNAVAIAIARATAP